jgi:hypothetical protein
MKKGTKYIVGFFSFILFCIVGTGTYFLWLRVWEYNQPFLTMGPDSVRESTAAMLYMTFSFLGTGAILFVAQVYNNIISFLVMKDYLLESNNQEAVKFLARMIWLSSIDLRKYPGNEYLIHRNFYPQADLLQRGKKIWVIKIKFKPRELVLTNKIGKLIYYEKNMLRHLIIRRKYFQFDGVIQSMAIFLQENFHSSLTDAQINNGLDKIFSTTK